MRKFKECARLICLFIGLCFTVGLNGQCYEVISDNLGFDSLVNPELDSVSCSLVENLPEDFNNFKIFSLTDYLLDQNFSNSQSENIPNEVDTEGYLILKKLINPESSKISINIEFEINKNFSDCYDKAEFKEDLEDYANAIVVNLGSNYFDLWKSEVLIVEYVLSELLKLYYCCDTNKSYDQFYCL